MVHTNIHPLQDALLAKEWQAVCDAAGQELRRSVASHVERDIDNLAALYGARTDTDPEASRFLASPDRRKEASRTARCWLIELLCNDDLPVADRIERQRASGEYLARIQYPMQAVASGARKLRTWIIAGLAESTLSPAQLLGATSYVSDLLDISVELRNAGSMRAAVRRTRIDEAYRMHAMGQNITTERERQRASLAEWAQEVLLMIHRPLVAPAPKLMKSEFGLWLGFRATALFENAPELGLVAESVGRIDDELLPRFDSRHLPGDANIGRLVEQLEAELRAIRLQVSRLFERHIELEHGREALTRLFHRRFTTTTPTHEGASHRRAGAGSVSVLILDIDLFQQIQDMQVNDAANPVLQRAIELVVTHVGPNDLVFRHGRKQILIVLVECDAIAAEKAAEKIRLLFQVTPSPHSISGLLAATLSVGIAQFSGHRDIEATPRTSVQHHRSRRKASDFASKLHPNRK